MSRGVALVAGVFLACATCARAQEDPSAGFEEAKALMKGALQAKVASARAALEARQKYEQALSALKGIKLLYPNWNPDDVSRATGECEKALSALTGAPVRVSAAPDGAAAGKAAATMSFIGHKKTKKYHRADCRYAMKLSDDVRVLLGSVEEAEAGGFTACKQCKPNEEELAASRASRNADAGEKKTPSGPFFGIASSMKVHRADCRWTKNTAEKHKIYFKSYAEAKAAGYSPCKLCRPHEEPGAAPEAPVERITAPPAAPSSRKPGDGKFCASDKGKTFHRSDCPWAKGIDQASLVTYQTREEAIAAHKKPCRICNP